MIKARKAKLISWIPPPRAAWFRVWQVLLSCVFFFFFWSWRVVFVYIAMCMCFGPVCTPVPSLVCYLICVPVLHYIYNSLPILLTKCHSLIMCVSERCFPMFRFSFFLLVLPGFWPFSLWIMLFCCCLSVIWLLLWTLIIFTGFELVNNVAFTQTSFRNNFTSVTMFLYLFSTTQTTVHQKIFVGLGKPVRCYCGWIRAAKNAKTSGIFWLNIFWHFSIFYPTFDYKDHVV